MTYAQLKDLQISNIISHTSEMKGLVKQCLSIAATSTGKDDEVVMWIDAAVSDMIRQGIDVAGNITDGLVQGTIVMYVKANFGFVDAKEKENAQKAYIRSVSQLSLSEKYKLVEVIEDA